MPVAWSVPGLSLYSRQCLYTADTLALNPTPLLSTDPKDTMFFFTTIALYQSITTQTQLRTLSNIDRGAKPQGQYFLVFSASPGLGFDIKPKFFFFSINLPFFCRTLVLFLWDIDFVTLFLKHLPTIFTFLGKFL